MKNYIDINKFHTFSIKRYHISKIKPIDVTKRMLLLSYLQISSLKYKTEEDIVRVCENLYDFRYSVKGDLHGTYWMITFQGNAIDPKYIDDEAYTKDKVVEVFNELSTPLVIDNKLDKKTFQRAKKLLQASILKLEKYPTVKATNFALHTFFKDTLRDYQPKGDMEELKRITIEELYEYYLEFLNEEEATIFIGDFNKNYPYSYKDTITPHNDHNFIERAPLDKDIYLYPYKSKLMNLRIIYDLNIFTGDNKIYALSLFNYFLGASSYSYLFRIVREKYGLCYSISTDLYGASGIVILSAEIKKDDLDIVISKIDEALNEAINSFDLEKVKRVFILTHKASYDNQDSYVSDLICEKAFPIAYDSKTYMDKINSVTIEDIKEVVDIFKKSRKVIFGYGGDKK